jgi:hypothetical protein
MGPKPVMNETLMLMGSNLQRPRSRDGDEAKVVPPVGQMRADFE